MPEKEFYAFDRVVITHASPMFGGTGGTVTVGATESGQVRVKPDGFSYTSDFDREHVAHRGTAEADAAEWDTETLFTAEQWSEALTAARGAGFDKANIYGAPGLLVGAWLAVHEEFDTEEYAAVALLQGLQKRRPEWSPSTLTRIAQEGFVWFETAYEAMAEYLNDNYPGIEPEWLKGDCPLWDAMRSHDSEMWVEHNDLSGVYIFAAEH